MTYTRDQIETDIANILNRSDLAASISSWFAGAYETLQIKLASKAQETVLFTPFIAGQSSYPLSLFLASPALTMGQIKEIDLVYIVNPALLPVPQATQFFIRTSIQSIRRRRLITDPR